MEPLHITLIVLGSTLGALFIYMIIMAVLASPQKSANDVVFSPLLQIDEEKVAKTLSDAVKFKTISLQNNDEDGQEFLNFQKFIEDTYPLIASRAKKTQINKYSVIYAIDGEDKSLNPIGIMGHQDVVPAPTDGWEVPPFDGTIKDGFVYGRGSQDMKSQIIASLESLELLLQNGFNIKRSIYFCFGHDEELRGSEGAMHIAKHLKQNGITFDFLLDEGGAILDGSMLGIKGPVALIGSCEKGYCDFLLSASVSGGHASTPPKKTAAALISEAILDITHSPMNAKFSKPIKQTFKTLAPHMNPIFKFLFVNLWFFSPLLKFIFKFNGVTNSIIRTTFAPTQLAGADAPNVLPRTATANINCRINHGETVEDALKHLKKILRREINVELDKFPMQPSPVASTTSTQYTNMESIISSVFGAVPAPFLFNAASDASHYYGVTQNIYRFTPFQISEDDGKRIHAINERQSIKMLVKGVEFYIRLYEHLLTK